MQTFHVGLMDKKYIILAFTKNICICLQAVDLRLRAIGRLKNLQSLDGKRVEDEEAALALRCAAGSRISQLSLLAHSRTDQAVPRSLSLGSSAHIITSVSRHKPMKSSETDATWYGQVSQYV